MLYLFVLTHVIGVSEQPVPEQPLIDRVPYAPFKEVSDVCSLAAVDA